MLTVIQPKHTRIGVDVGATGVRAVQLLRSGTTYTVRAIARSERPVGEPDDGGLSLERRVASCMQSGGFRGRSALVGARAGEIEYHLLNLPAAVAARSDDEASRAVRWEVASLMGESVENVEARHWLVPPPSAPGPNTLAVGARTDSVRRTFDALTNAGAVCTTIDTPATALCRVACALRPPPPRAVWGILDLGHDQTRLVICVDETPVLIRSVGPGGNGWTRSIAESLRISITAAEIHKREHGIARTPRGVRGDDGTDVPSRELGSILYGALRSDLNGIAGETMRSFRYVLGCYAGREVDELVLVGGGASMKLLPEFLNENVGATVHRASDYLERSDCRIRFSSGRGDPFEPLALAVGLTLPG